MHKLFGETEDSVIVLDFEVGKYLSLCGTEYDKLRIIEDDDEGERMAMDYLSEGDSWRQCVADGGTELGMTDWNEMVIDSDGWQEILGDIYETKNGKYIQSTSCGQISINPDKLTKIFIHVTDVYFILDCWQKYHLQPIASVPKDVIERMQKIFEYETDIDDWSNED